MKQYQSKHTAVLSTRGFYTILSLCALIIAASAWVIWGNAHRQNAVEPDTGMPIIAPADSTAEAPTEPATVPQQEQEPESVIEEQPVAAAEPEPAVTVSAPVYVRPVSGAVLTPFSGDTLLFQPTMGDWRVHAGTDFSAEAGETVLALTDGTVQQIAEDGLYGTCVTLTLPVGLFTCITGVSGSGKSTLINDTLFPIAQRQLNGATIAEPAPYRDIQGLEHFDKVIDIDQSPIGRTPRSNPATYTGVFTPVRELFAGVPESRARGYTPGRFSFNVRGGRCEACQGDGVIKVEMHFLPDIYVPCDQCKGKRYNRETLEIKYKGKTIHEVLDMTIEEAREFFDAVPALARKLQTLMDVGLTYIRLGQSATTLSGGEAQRVKLARELSKRGTGQTLYILDEPTTGLHFADIQQLLDVLHKLRDQGNTIVVIEHNLDVIKTADWIVDLGPEGGSGGGEILVSGTPETVAECEASHTARFLKPML